MQDIIRNKSLVDDLANDDDAGPAIIFSNAELRKMLRLVKANRDDLLYDFGSGWGQALIVALTEFGINKAVGIERIKARYQTAKDRLSSWERQRPDLAGRWKLLHTNFDRILSNDEKRLTLTDATIVYYGLETDRWVLDRITKAWDGAKGRRRLVYYYNCLFPEIMPDAVDHPFLVSNFPFRSPRSVKSWLMAVTCKSESSYKKGRSPDEGELWDEISHDYRVDSSAPLPDTINNYKRRLRHAVRNY